MLKSFKYAINGIRDAFKSEPNLRFHFIAAIAVISLAIYMKFSFIEVSILALTIGLVVTLELINTVIEKIVDLVHPQISDNARAIKDISAASVFISAMTAIVVAAYLFLPKIILYL
jgi:diacylglycerol kinase